jgi:transposase
MKKDYYFSAIKILELRMKFRPYEQNQITFLPQSIEDLVPKNHLVRAIDLVVEQLSLRELYMSYSEEGQPGYHPKMLLKILLYGYSIGVRSSRKIAEKLESDVFFMYLSAQQKPDFRTISDFRLNKREYLKEYFKEVLQICKQMGLIQLGHISIDGTKVEANSSRKLMLDKEDLFELERRIEKKIKAILDNAEEIDQQEDRLYGKEKRGDELPDDLSTTKKLLEKIKQAKKHLEENDLKRVSITDPESRIMLTNNGGTDICYNAQAVIDNENQVIVACQISNHETDSKNFIPMYEEVLDNLENKPKEISADAGYYSGATYLYIEKNHIDAYLPDCKFGKETDDYGNEVIGEFDRRKFRYDKIDDNYICPDKKKMRFNKNSIRNGVKFRVYKGQSCINCQYRGKCISKPHAKYREIQIYENDKFKQEMRDKLLSKKGKIKYKRRMIIEPVFAHLKRIMLFRQFLLRGIDKTSSEWNLLCTAYNIKKLSKHLSFGTL